MWLTDHAKSFFIKYLLYARYLFSLGKKDNGKKQQQKNQTK